MAANIQRASPNCRTTTLHHTAHPVSLGSLVDSLQVMTQNCISMVETCKCRMHLQQHTLLATQAALLHRAHVTVPWHLTTALLISAATTTSYNTSPLLLLCVTQETCMHQRLLAHAAKVMGVGVHTAQPGCPLPASVVCHDQSATSKGRPCMVVQGGHMGAARDGMVLKGWTCMCPCVVPSTNAAAIHGQMYISLYLTHIIRRAAAGYHAVDGHQDACSIPATGHRPPLLSGRACITAQLHPGHHVGCHAPTHTD